MCRQQFSRRWNAERHIKTVHPSRTNLLLDKVFYNDSTIDDSQQSRSVQDTQSALSIDSFRAGRIEDIHKNFFKLASLLNKGSPVNRPIHSSPASQEIYSTHVFLPKSWISGISGFVCPICIKFEAVYIKDLGFDRTMKNKHGLCSPSDLEVVAKNPDFKSILPAVELEANEKLFSMTKSWLSAPAFINTIEIPSNVIVSPEFYIIDLTGMPPDNWLWQFTREKRKQLDDNKLEEIFVTCNSYVQHFRSTRQTAAIDERF